MPSTVDASAILRAPFTKMQAVGNDFVLLDEAFWPANADWSQHALRLCDRHNGIGADGLLVVGPSDVADIRMRMFNPDGTEDMCGNGLRCVVRYGYERGRFAHRMRRLSPLDSGPAVVPGRAETLDGVHEFALMLSASLKQAVGNFGLPDLENAVVLHPPRFAPADIPFAACGDITEVIDYPLPVEDFGSVQISSVNTGSTHTIIWVDRLPEDDRFIAVSSRIENHVLFPERTSVIWAAADPHDRSSFDVRIWERGVGETLGCGTGASAVGVLAIRRGIFENPRHAMVSVRSCGGTLRVAWRGNADDSVRLSGPAVTVFEGFVPVS